MFTLEQKSTQGIKSTSSMMSSWAPSRQSHEVNSILQLQPAIGNQTTLRLLQSKIEDLHASQVSNASTVFAYDFSRIPVYASADSRIQAKLKVNAPKDKSEQEAEQVAQRVISQLNTSTPLVQSAQPEDLSIKPRSMSQTNCGADVTPDIVASIQQTRGTGRALPVSFRAQMEQAFGIDFRGVKIHTDAQSDQLSRSIQARAFTIGPDIFFRQGEYDVSNRPGQELMAHELTHVVQQDHSRTGMPPSVQRVPGEGVDQYLSNYGLSYFGTGDIPPSPTLPPSTEAGLRQARTEFDRANGGENHFSRNELDRIHQGFEAIFRGGGARNLHLWIAILHYFTTRPLQRVQTNQVRFGGMQTSADYRAQVPSNVFTDSRVSNESIATMLMHEYAHIMQTRTSVERTRAGTCSEIPESEADPDRPRMSTMCREPGEVAGVPAMAGQLEADNYAIEYFYLERAGAGGARRLTRIFDIYASPDGEGVASPGLVDSFQRRFQGTYGTLKCLYDIIDHEAAPDYTSVYAPQIPALVNITSAEQASRLVHELVEQGVVYIRGILRTIFDGVLSHPGLFPISRPSPSHSTERPAEAR